MSEQKPRPKRENLWELTLVESDKNEFFSFPSRAKAIDFLREAGLTNKEACTLKSKGQFKDDDIEVILKEIRGDQNARTNRQVTTDT